VHTGFWWGNLRARDHVEHQGVDGSSRSGMGGGDGLDLSGSEWGQVAGCCECGNEPAGSIKCGEFLD